MLVLFIIHHMSPLTLYIFLCILQIRKVLKAGGVSGLSGAQNILTLGLGLLNQPFGAARPKEICFVATKFNSECIGCQ